MCPTTDSICFDHLSKVVPSRFLFGVKEPIENDMKNWDNQYFTKQIRVCSHKALYLVAPWIKIISIIFCVYQNNNEEHCSVYICSLFVPEISAQSSRDFAANGGGGDDGSDNGGRKTEIGTWE